MATGRVPTTANSPLTAKGDLFGYSTTQARVAVGNNGETLVADSSTSTGLRYQGNYAAGKNAIINGDFNINQRGFTSTTTNDVYTFDRWISGIVPGTGVGTLSAQTFTAGTAPVAGYESTNYLRIVTTGVVAGGTTTSQVRAGQRIENVRTFAGQTMTVSLWAKAASGTPNIGVAINQNFGSGGSATVTTLAGAVTAITTGWVRYSFTVAVPSISGKTIGTSSYLDVRIFVVAGSAISAVSAVGLQDNTFEIWGVQAEAGSVATAFQTATGTIQGELAAAQRYYLKSYNQATAPATATTVSAFAYAAVNSTNTDNRVNVRFPVNMRSTPTITLYSSSTGTSAKIFNENLATDLNGATQFVGETGFHAYPSSGTVSGSGTVLIFHYVASAEL
jgi:hypothetical protein